MGAKRLEERLAKMRGEGRGELDLSRLGLTDEDLASILSRAGDLSQVRSLNASRNTEITDEGVGAVAASLRSLTSLDLSGCERVSDEGVRAVAASLRSLTSLNLAGCDRIERLPKALAHFLQLRYLKLPDNKTLGLPAEIIANPFNPAAILDYYFRGVREGKRQLNEAKLLVVGNEAVGKTSLVNYLVKGEPCRPGEAKTPGVNILERIGREHWHLAGADDPRSLRLNVWDFGGQEVMYRTHQFFLTQRSLYLLVLEARRENVAENDGFVREWLRTIRDRAGDPDGDPAGDPKVILVVNKSEPPHDLRLDEAGLKRDFPNLDFADRTSCLDPEKHPEGGRGIRELRERIVRTVGACLAHVRDWMPISYFEVKEALRELARTASVFDKGDYRKLCIDKKITEPREQDNLLRLLHEIGVVVDYDDLTLLDPNWLTTAVYRLLTHPSIRDAGGEFAYPDLGNLLAELPADKYPRERWRFVVEMTKRFRLSFQLADGRGERYLVPEQLPPSEPATDFDESGCLRFRFGYDHLPQGLIPEFIVSAHHLLATPRVAWLGGVVLEIEGCRVLVRAVRAERRIDVFVSGPAERRRSALGVVRDHFARIHRCNRSLQPKEMVPLPDLPAVAAEYLWLLQHEDDKDEYCRPPGATKKYRVADLLDGVDAGGRRRPYTEDDPRSYGDQYNSYFYGQTSGIGVGSGHQMKAEVVPPPPKPSRSAPKARVPAKPAAPRNRAMTEKKAPRPGTRSPRP